MSLRTTVRLGGADDTPLSFEVQGWLSPASTLLLYLSLRKGVKIVAKKSWALTDDFEAYFTYKGRLFIMQTPMVDLWVSLIGQPPDYNLFSEIMRHVQNFNWLYYFLAPLAIIRYFFLPFNPPRELLEAQGIDVSKWWR
jgi:hypothetical protein